MICVEGFSALLRKAELEGRISGVKICPGAPSVSHLLFADDSLLLVCANREDALQLQNILEVYEQCSGQMINKAKSAVLFSKNTSAAKRAKLRQIMQIERETGNDPYLGLPVHVGRSKKNTFAYLKERVWKKIQGWKEKLLSRAGKEILIKAVAQAIPTFAMGCFDITKTVCDQISTIVARFWWSKQDKEDGMHWLSWEKLTRTKKDGGLGFRDIHSFNMAMLAK